MTAPRPPEFATPAAGVDEYRVEKRVERTETVVGDSSAETRVCGIGVLFGAGADGTLEGAAA